MPLISGVSTRFDLTLDYDRRSMRAVRETWSKIAGENGSLLEKQERINLEIRVQNLSHNTSKGEVLCHTGATTG